LITSLVAGAGATGCWAGDASVEVVGCWEVAAPEGDDPDVAVPAGVPHPLNTAAAVRASAAINSRDVRFDMSTSWRWIGFVRVQSSRDTTAAAVPNRTEPAGTLDARSTQIAGPSGNHPDSDTRVYATLHDVIE
jgi:hypothetical protein